MKRNHAHAFSQELYSSFPKIISGRYFEAISLNVYNYMPLLQSVQVTIMPKGERNLIDFMGHQSLS